MKDFIKFLLFRPPVSQHPFTNYCEARLDIGHYHPWHTSGKWISLAVVVFLVSVGFLAS